MTAAEPELPPVILLTTSSTPWSVPSGWHVHDGFAVPDHPWDLTARQLICHGAIANKTDVVSAVTALSRGTGLAVSLALTGDLRFRLLEDLHQLGTITEPTSAEDGGLGPDHRLLLDALIEGDTVTGAARRLNMSRRTAGRRLLEIRAALGVDSTAEAIIWWSDRT